MSLKTIFLFRIVCLIVYSKERAKYVFANNTLKSSSYKNFSFHLVALKIPWCKKSTHHWIVPAQTKNPAGPFWSCRVFSLQQALKYRLAK